MHVASTCLSALSVKLDITDTWTDRCRDHVGWDQLNHLMAPVHCQRGVTHTIAMAHGTFGGALSNRGVAHFIQRDSNSLFWVTKRCGEKTTGNKKTFSDSLMRRVLITALVGNLREHSLMLNSGFQR